MWLHPSFHYLACDQLTEDGCSEAAEAVEEEIPPFGSASRSECLLAYLDESAQKDRGHDSPWDKAGGVWVCVALEILEPQYGAETKIHEKM